MTRRRAQLLLSMQRQVRTRMGTLPSRRAIHDWVLAALGSRARQRSVELAVTVVSRARSRALNRHYRQQDHATNVLSFPAAGPTPPGQCRLGDLVLCADVIAREARSQGKPLRAHWAHMIVHGVLHLLGFDHQIDSDAQRMERREVRILASLGFANPYRMARQAVVA